MQFSKSSLSANEAWLSMLTDLIHYGDAVAPRGQTTLELLGYQSGVDMARPLVTVAARCLEGKTEAFRFAEAHWILSGSNKVRDMLPYSSMITKFSDDGRFFRGAYGPKIVDQLTFVTDQLLSDIDTRQAVMSIWRENPAPSKDTPCTLSFQFLARGGLLHCNATMRSSDAWLGWPFDVFNFSMLTHYIILMLRERSAGSVLLRPGTLRLTAGSQHLYDRNRSKVDKILDLDQDEGFSRAYEPLDPHQFGTPDDLMRRLAAVRDICNEDAVFANLDLPYLLEWIDQPRMQISNE